MRCRVSFSMIGKMAPYSGNGLDCDRWYLFSCLVTMFLLCGNDGHAPCSPDAPVTVRDDEGGCAINADYRNFTTSDTGDGRCHGLRDFVKVRDNGDAGNKGKRGNGVPDLREVEEHFAHHHRASRTPGDYAAALVDLLYSAPCRRSLERFQQISRLAARKVDEVGIGNLLREERIVGVFAREQQKRLNRRAQLRKMLDSQVVPAFGNASPIGRRGRWQHNYARRLWKLLEQVLIDRIHFGKIFTRANERNGSTIDGRHSVWLAFHLFFSVALSYRAVSVFINLSCIPI